MSDRETSPGWQRGDEGAKPRGSVQPGEMLCEREGCRHPADWHRLDDSLNVSPTDPNAPFRCIGYDVARLSSPLEACPVACPDFLPPPEWDAS